jgi:ubiquinone/menaquinone biosynthesis C-methylase UbiE
MSELFDDWPERYDAWFETPIGALIKKYESELILKLLHPVRGDRILDVGCGTGIFTFDILNAHATVIGLDISLPMLKRAQEKALSVAFAVVAGDMVRLPFRDNFFDKVVSITALEFIEDARSSIDEMFRVVRRGGHVVVATLNSLSPWAHRRKAEADKQETIFRKVIFRSADDLRALAPVDGIIETAIHFQKGDDPQHAQEIEKEARRRTPETGAFIAVLWQKQ